MYSLIRTKFEIPPPPKRAVDRSRLVQALEEAASRTRLVLITAPAGYGKSTLLTQWAHASLMAVAWFTCSAEDNDFERFFRSLVSAWELSQPGIMESHLGLLLGGINPKKEDVISSFVNTAAALETPLVFVLDDFHLIQDAECLEALAALLDNLPFHVHFLLAGREQPVLPLARYRARGKMMEIGTAELSFTLKETQAFFNKEVAHGLDPSSLQNLRERLEGWVTGYQLAVLSMRRGLVAVDDLALGGDQRFIADYLREEILDPLPQIVRQFLLQTGILERFNANLCQAVTQRQGGQEMLERLDRENLFLIPLDDRRQWYRYHELFADFLRKEARRQFPIEIKEWHSRAAQWYLDEKMPEPAFQHALAGRDSDLMAELAYRYFEPMLYMGELNRLKSWLDAIPEDWHFSHPVIGICHAFFLAHTGNIEACLHKVNKIEQFLQESDREDKREQIGRINTLRCVIACFQQKLDVAEPLANQALQELAQSDQHYRASIYQSIGEAYRDRGRWPEAKQQFFKALELVRDPAFRIRSAHIYGALADLELQRGRLRKAADYWQEALDVVEDQQFWGRIPLTLRGWVYMRMGEIQYEWNELDQAGDFIIRGLERAEIGGDVRSIIAGNILLGRLRLTEGDLSAAAAHLEQASLLLQGSQFHEWNSRFQRLQVEIWLAQGELDKVMNWSEWMLSELGTDTDLLHEAAQLTLARALLIQEDGQAQQQSRKLLAALAEKGQTQGRLSQQIEALALQALAYWQEDYAARAMTLLEHALRLAQPQGYVRLFADLGLPMARALQEARDREVMVSYGEQLLAAFNQLPMTGDKHGQALPEPLTDREQEILVLMSAGLTNREIGEELFIASGTVKKHAANIYSKLDVGGRTEAAARARELGLLN